MLDEFARCTGRSAQDGDGALPHLNAVVDRRADPCGAFVEVHMLSATEECWGITRRQGEAQDEARLTGKLPDAVRQFIAKQQSCH